MKRPSTASTAVKRRKSNLQRGLLTPSWAARWPRGPMTPQQRRRREAAKRAKVSRRLNR